MPMRRLLPALVLACLAGTAALPPAAHAEAPLAKTQAPGWYRTLVGDVEVTALSDGTLALPVTKLLKGDPKKMVAALRRNHLGEQVETSVNGYLVNTGSKLVLIDTGAGSLFGPTLGGLVANLKAAGYQPEQVDEIYITHMHGDHVGGLVANNQRVFANAVLRIDKRDVDYWLSEANMNAAPDSAKDFFKGAMLMAGPYQQAGKLKPFEGATELVPGVRAQPAYGHTPGHTIYTVESKGRKLVLWGDLMHVAAVQFEDPTVTIAFDSDARKAMPARQKAYAEAAKTGDLVGASHLSFPGLGYLRAAGKGYTFLPLNYSTLK
ncbi:MULTISPECIES: MBL fold metallo-hydrolase [Ramlibacter]|uniref:MBL fold metallo-hydrolase n=1 Tax=Ramlibacter pinisoli TaxID=2682844 RepID=A0A6N8J0R5_9BURK|nr:MULTISPECIES: MBL fold metallo-hydrolase [Ramlibacter]MBA2962755.1 MBL fold metallo-hydrolase [Ramlibacter sp. CGMCC 1.13660]MVQ32697.1 MBL fold metallo-hydrolase [Ramlibacter pinisoli]